MSRTLPLIALVLAASAWAKPPRLTLIIVVDAMGSDILLRARPHLRAGLSQVLSHGAFFPYAHYEYAETVTAPGHSTLATGANPWRHGITGNTIFNRSTGRRETIFSDPLHPILEAPPTLDDTSPEALATETLSDRLRLFTQGRGKAIAIAGKARAAIAMAGRLGQAWWFNTQVGRFVTGTYYAKEFPTWVKAFNQRKVPDSFFGQEWALSLPPSEYVGDDNRPIEDDAEGLGRAFPHPIGAGAQAPGPQFYATLTSTPMMNDVLVRAAQAAIEGEELGKDEVPDLLCVGMSPLDLIYHWYGPYSWEVQDAMVKLDRSIGDLVASAEKAAGKGNLLVVLSADHGGAAIAEEWASAGMPASRVDVNALQQGLRHELQSKYGSDLVIGIGVSGAYLNSKTMAEKKLDAVAIRRASARWLGSQPSIQVAVARDDLYSSDPAAGYLRSLQRGYFPERSGDVLFVLRPFQVTEGAGFHGTPHLYDSEVPVIFSGKGVKAGWHGQIISPVDVAPTIAAILEMGQPASAEGRVLSEALTGPGR